MSKQIQYSDEPIGKIRLVTDFLPSPEDLPLKMKNTKVTISLSSESVVYFKEMARKHNMQYQKIIRELLDEYVARQKTLTNKTYYLNHLAIPFFTTGPMENPSIHSGPKVSAFSV